MSLNRENSLFYDGYESESEWPEVFGDIAEARMAPLTFRRVLLAGGFLGVLLFAVIAWILPEDSGNSGIGLVLLICSPLLGPSALVGLLVGRKKKIANSYTRAWMEAADRLGLEPDREGVELVPAMEGEHRGRKLEVRAVVENGDVETVVGFEVGEAWTGHELIPRDSLYFRADEGHRIDGSDSGGIARIYGPDSERLARRLEGTGVASRLVEFGRAVDDWKISDGQLAVRYDGLETDAESFADQVDDCVDVADRIENAVDTR